MPSSAIGPLILFLAILLTGAHLLGYLFARLRQPRVIGEILAGCILGPFVLGRWAAYTHFLQLDVAAPERKAALDLLYYLGLLMLMFLSGAETKALFQKHERRQIGWLAAVGTALPFFVMLALGSVLPLGWFMGVKSSRASLLLVMSIAVAVTSIPVISRIFFDLKILHTRFARLVLGVAVLEDIVLWAVLAIATAIADSSGLPARRIALHIGVTLVYFILGLVLFPRATKRMSKSRFNLLAINSPVTFTLLIAFAYVAVAGLLDVNLIFAAFLAGFAVSRKRLGDALACRMREALEHQRFLRLSSPSPYFLCTACLLTPSWSAICCHDQPSARAFSTCSRSSDSSRARSEATARSPVAGSALDAAPASSVASVIAVNLH